jgi:hypothetical protein
MKKTIIALAIAFVTGAIAQTTNTSTSSTTGRTTTNNTSLINQGTYDSKALVDTNSTSNSTSTVTSNSNTK